MNKDLALQQPECEVLIPLEFTEEIKPETFGLEITEATQLLRGIDIISAELEVLKNAYIDVIGLEITTEILPTFKELRLKIVKNRTSRDKWRKAKKAYFLNGGRFVDAIAKKYDVDNEEMEVKLMEAEKYFENLEKEAKRILNEKRIEIIRPYVEDVSGLDFSDFSDENFDDYVLGKKTRYNERIEVDRLEALRVKEQEEKQRVISKNKDALLPWKLFIENFEEIDFEKVDLISVLEMAKNKKTESEAKVAAQEIENKRLKKESDDKDAALAKQKADSDKLLADTKAKSDKLALDLKEKQDAETKAENERLAKIKADKKAAELAAKAPVKKQLSVWVESFELPFFAVDNEKAKQIKEKFEAFKRWSQKEIETI